MWFYYLFKKARLRKGLGKIKRPIIYSVFLNNQIADLNDSIIKKIYTRHDIAPIVTHTLQNVAPVLLIEVAKND